MKMFRLGKIIPIVRTRSAAQQVITLNDNVPVCLHADRSGNLWVRVSAGGASTIDARNDTDNQAPVATGILPVNASNYGYDPVGNNWDRMIVGPSNADLPVSPLGIQQAASLLYGYNPVGDFYERVHAEGTDSDAVATDTRGSLETLARLTIFNGAAYDRVRSASAANLAALSGLGAVLVATPGNWAINHTPAAAAQATITRAAGAAGVRHIAMGISYGFNAINIEAGTFLINLRDGTTGAGTILQSWRVGPFAIGASVRENISNLNIVGSAATAMTMEFAGAPAAGNFEYVNLTGYDVT